MKSSISYADFRIQVVRYTTYVFLKIEFPQICTCCWDLCSNTHEIFPQPRDDDPIGNFIESSSSEEEMMKWFHQRNERQFFFV